MPWVRKKDSAISTDSKETIEHTWGKNCVPLCICGYRFLHDLTFAPYRVLRTKRRRTKVKSNVQSEPTSPPVSTHLQHQRPRCSRFKPTRDYSLTRVLFIHLLLQCWLLSDALPAAYENHGSHEHRTRLPALWGAVMISRRHAVKKKERSTNPKPPYREFTTIPMSPGLGMVHIAVACPWK